MRIFGPVPSRRLGSSLGINIIPAKVCSYGCVYCQIGRTSTKQVTRQAFFDSASICQETAEKIARINDPIDYLTFVADGEPTLDCDLGQKIDLLKHLGFKVAVISNASLITDSEVQSDLYRADLVSLKVDAAARSIWKAINHPHKSLSLQAIQEGMLTFAAMYAGTLLTETMLVKGINDSEEHLDHLARFLLKLNPQTAYLSVPIRPPAFSWVTPPDEDVINRAYQQLTERCRSVEYLIGYEGNSFSSTGNAEEDLLSITAVHPMREDAVTELLKRTGEDWSVIDRLQAQDRVVVLDYRGKRFIMRKTR